MHSTSSTPTWRYWPLLLVLTTLTLLVLKAWTQLGVPFPFDGDSTVFLPQAVHYRLDGHLINTVYWETIKYAPERDGRYIWHGFLFPLLTAHLMPRADYSSAMEVIFGYQTVTIVLLAFALFFLRPRDAASAFSMATALVICSVWMEVGRPESLVSFLLTLGLLLFLHTRPAWRPLLAGVTMGLVAATSLLPAAFFGLLYAAYLALAESWLKCLMKGTAVAFIAVAVFAATFLVYPYTFSEWCMGTREHATFCLIAHHLTLNGFIQGWVKNTGYTLALFWLGLFASLLFAYASKIDWRTRGWRFGFITLVVIMFIAIVRTSGDERLYNIMCLSPLFLFATQAMLWTMAEGWKARTRKAVALVLVIFTLVTFLPQVDIALLRFHTSQGLDREHAQAKIDKIMQEEPGQIDFSCGLFSLMPQPRGGGLAPYDYLNLQELQSKAPIVLIQQNNPYKAEPPTYTNYTLVQNYFTNYVPTFLGLRLAKSPRVYNFAVYKRNEPASP